MENFENLTNVLKKPCNCANCNGAGSKTEQKSTNTTNKEGFLDGLFGNGIPVDTSVSIDIPASVLVKIGISIVLIFLIVVLVQKNLK